ncbi:PDDEXK nuclease domain-containing protein [Desulfovibrio gilichinskyi]|uniref:Predicted nuclease of restriction endonuclease-like (RecB) superfamily, DUF1016 family n=1 Tax=Desulfovibrio gilichinskyi TaxID=1519643 RepID=A0A1X7F2D5_9BACT|nr:PDDEXK nuclease domain-containing protein [Desulfovibrio gilichinskyi]SMF44201.1 Predicted nuclease of restriction endonuclease-like (RecB) superfamily, DUF1016 family [Desulfovibrio gilichinskyi]
MTLEKHENNKPGNTTENKTIMKVGFDDVVGLFEKTQSAMQSQVARSVDIALVVRNWLFGWYIVEFENGGAERADLYGKRLIESLSERLVKLGIKGMSPTNLRKFREFYQAYAKIQQTLSVTSLSSSEKIQQTESAKSQTTQTLYGLFSIDGVDGCNLWQTLSMSFHLSWSHYVVLLTIKSSDERKFYEIEAIENSWSLRELKRQINSSFYERLALSRDKEKVRELSEEGQLVSSPKDVLKSPYVLEFLGLEENFSYSEHDLETAIINKIEHFLLELGKGFLFEARQKRFTFDDDHFYVDLVFYNRLLRCYVVIDLKRERLTHQDLGQMQMYVNYFDRHVKLADEKPTIGILLCHSKSDGLVELTLPKESNIYASQYQLYLPSKEELKKQLEEAQQDWEAHHEVEI